MFTFGKNQRLCSKKKIETLFRQGKSFLVFPISVRCITEPGEGNIRTLIVCPKRYQRKAVCRNRIKRLIRENYRLNSTNLKRIAKENSVNIDFSMSYVHKQTVDYSVIQKTVTEILSKLELTVSSLQKQL
ncbi:MAG: ribonuclease P protein component [Bacteroidales bacterium]|nr:ribonuclease P protein component [Bacteroidales bacterium]